MLELIGSEYVIDHVISEHNLRIEEKIYRSYVSDILMIMAEGKTAQVQHRYTDLIDKPKEENEKTADEIALEVITRAGLKGKTDERNGAGSEAIA